MSDRVIEERAPARVGLLGNPSDLYGGRGIGFALEEFGATVRLSSAGTASVPNELLRACWRRFADETGVVASPFELECTSDVPYQSGLAGSSAILIAALRAWARWCEVELAPDAHARIALATEREDLGIRAGPLDRLVQAHGGLLFMDFAAGTVEALEAASLPPLVVAWNRTPGERSGDVHEPIWLRFEAGDADVRATMEALAAAADAGRAALAAGDFASLRRLVDRNFELRARLFPIAASDRAMIDIARSRGAGAKFCGSGGSVVCVPEDGDADGLAQAFEDAGCGAVVPAVTNAGGER